MAESLLFNIASNIIQTLTPIIVEQIAASWGAEDELRRLMNNTGIIKGVLLDAEQRQHGSEAVKEWVKMVKNVIYEVDDMVELISIEAKKEKLVALKQKRTNKVRKFFSQSNPFIRNQKLAYKVKELKARVDVVISTMAVFNFVVRDVEENIPFRSGRNGQTCGLVDTEEIIGREGDKKTIIEMLLKDEGGLSVIPIVGIGGLGKTALAQLVYNDKIVNRCFDVKLWLCIPDCFDVHSIVKNMVRAIDHKVSVNKLGFDKLVSRMQEVAQTKRFLLILDDIWNENRGNWLALKSVLPVDCKGFKIIISTRSRIVANIMGTVPPYELQGLSDEKSWSLFTRVAFKPGQIEDNPELVVIGKQIIKKCANVPLAIRTLGSLLYYKETMREWLYIKDEELSKIEQDENHILPVLRISYTHLTPHLKHCFAFCALYPKDFELNKEDLINQWIAAGFIKPSNKNQSLEDTGDDYFMLLLRRCFFQDVKRDVSSAIISCKVHDLIHDLAQLVAGEDIAYLENDDFGSLCDGIRYVSIKRDELSWRASSSWRIPQTLLKATQLRILILPYPSELSLNALSKNFSVLRMLDLSSSGLKSIPSSIKELKLLRYLYLSSNMFTKLPDSLTELLNLQLLDLHACHLLEQLPRAFEKLVSLKFLDIRGCDKLIYLPLVLNDESPSYLRSLSNYKFTQMKVDACKNRHEGGSSILTLIGNIGGATELQLRLEPDLLVESHRLPTNFRVLNVRFFAAKLLLTGWTTTVPGPFISLVDIMIEHCDECKHLPPLGLLPSLKFLILRHLHALQEIEHNTDECLPSPLPSAAALAPTFFPSLEELELHDLLISKYG